MNNKHHNGAASLILILTAVLACLAGCRYGKGSEAPFNIDFIESYKDIPGITADEIAAIEELKAAYGRFTYGQMIETEAYILPDGTPAGFAIEFCRLLSGLFGIEFAFEFHEWESLINGLSGMEIDFTGDLNSTPERRQSYYMSHTIAERSQRIFTLSHDYSIMRENDAAGLKIGYLGGTVDAGRITEFYPELEIDFTAVDSIDTAVQMMLSGEIAAFASAGVLEIQFAPYYDLIRSREFFPLVYTPVSFTTANEQLLPFINAVDKYLAAGGVDVLFDLYTRCSYDYARYKLNMTYTQEERSFLDALALSGSPVKIALQGGNYPVSFYDRSKKRFEGIAVDIINEITDLTGIRFETGNDPDTDWSHLLWMLRTGEVSMISQLLYSNERSDAFLWSARPYTTASYALISKYDYPSLANFQVVRAKVGTVRNSAYEDKYNEWFPDNANLVTYGTQEEALAALEKGDVDLLMGSDYTLLMQHNFFENPGFKINILFHQPMESFFGFNINERELCSIVSKTLDHINVDRIANIWKSRGYDYERRLNRVRLIYVSVIAAITIFLFIRVAIFNRSLNKRIKERTSKLEQQTLAAQAASKAKSVFLANMSHEIRTPMNAILGITEILLQDRSIPENAADALGKIYESGDLLMGIINDILDLSKIEAGRLELTPVKYDIPGLINETVQLNRMRYESKNVQFFLEVEIDTPMNLYGDELRIKQILNNILSNAFKYTDKGRIEMSVYAEQEETGNDEIILVLRVSDTGQGMSQDQIGRVFDEYVRFNMEENRTIVGTGLGMSITKHLVELMNGEITVDSEIGRGTVFTVRLPQKRLDFHVCNRETIENLRNFSYQSSLVTKNSSMLREYMPYGSVLIVDDVETNNFVTRGMLLPYGLKIDSANSGTEAVEKIKAGCEYDVIFMDHMMPKMSGIEAVKIMREMGYKKPIVALTANAIVGQLEMFMKNGFDGFITKPIDSRELNAALNEFIRSKKPHEEAKRAKDAEKSDEGADRMTENKTTAGSAAADSRRGISEVEKFFLVDAKNAVETLESMGDKFTEDDLESYEIIVHGMKSALANIGKKELSKKALWLEEAALKKDLAAVNEKTGAFVDELKEMINRLSSAAEAGNAAAAGKREAITGEDAAFLRDKLDELKTACNAFDSKTAKNAVNVLCQKKWPRQIEDALDEINVHLLHSAFKKAALAADAVLPAAEIPAEKQ